MKELCKELRDSGNQQHFLIAFALSMITVVIGIYIKGATPYGGIVAITWFVCRECVQAEYEWIEHYGKGLRANMPMFAFLSPKVWSLHSYMGIVSAVLGVFCSYLGYKLLP